MCFLKKALLLAPSFSTALAKVIVVYEYTVSINSVKSLSHLQTPFPDALPSLGRCQPQGSGCMLTV